jgi:HYDIN/CFA65/VesB-like, Ig-like domain
VIGNTSASKQLTLTNQGSGALKINKTFIAGANAGEFTQTNNCPSSLPAGGFCTVSLTFTSGAAGKRQAVLGISSSDPASPQAIPVLGTGTAVSLSPKLLSFGTVPVGSTKSPRTVTLTNVGSTQLKFSGFSIVGTNAPDFSQTNTCGTSIAAGAQCTITVTFKPTALGMRKASVSITDDGGGSPQGIALSGTGI